MKMLSVRSKESRGAAGVTAGSCSRPGIVITCVLLALGAAVRLAVSRIAGIWFASDQLLDDVLMLTYALPNTHFGMPGVNSLVKSMSYPLFLDAVWLSHVGYDLWLGMLWVLAALSVFFVFQKLLRNRPFAVFAYFYVLFLPAGLEDFIGFRLYRNGIIDPFVIMLFSLVLLLVWLMLTDETVKLRRIVLLSVICGVLLSFSYYIKEDGIWILCCVGFGLLSAVIGLSVRFRKRLRCRRLRVSLICAVLPVVMLCAVTAGYKAVNGHFFGVSEIETRTSGELGGFVARAYRVDSENKSSVIWVPADVVTQVFDASPTLSAMPELRETLLTKTVYGDVTGSGFTGDYLGWALRDALNQTGYWTSEQEVSALFSKINGELDTAFKNGILKETDRIRLLGSAGRFTAEEVLSLKREIVSGYLGAIVQKGYYAGIAGRRYQEASVNPEYTALANRLTNTGYLGVSGELTSGQELLHRMLDVMFKLYAVLNVMLLLMSVYSVFAGAARFFTKKDRSAVAVFSWLSGACFLGISAVYILGISWFSHFIWGDGEIVMYILNYYACALPAILMFSYLFSLARMISSDRRRK